jgi:hypothetical protein
MTSAHKWLVLKRPLTSLDEEYLKAGGKISRWRVVLAGCRLGAVLREIEGAD